MWQAMLPIWCSEELALDFFLRVEILLAEKLLQDLSGVSSVRGPRTMTVLVAGQPHDLQHLVFLRGDLQSFGEPYFSTSCGFEA